MPTALITGVCGQDGSFLTELLLAKGYEVHGTTRNIEAAWKDLIGKAPALAEARDKTLFLHLAELEDIQPLVEAMHRIQPDEIYHLAGQSHVGKSFNYPVETSELIGMATVRLLEGARSLPNPPRFLNAGSAEIFGRTAGPQDEDAPIQPVSPYGVAKAFAVQMVRVYRETHGMFACNAICYNHESERRPASFVTRKISQAAARASLDPSYRVSLGNLDIERDWGYAPEYVEAMRRMLQCETAQDMVIATGKLTSLKMFLEHAFNHVGLDWRDYVDIDQSLFRPNEPVSPVGNPQRAKTVMNWQPATEVAELAGRMVAADVKALQDSDGASEQNEQL